MTVLYRKYRPQKLSEVVGQETITSTLLKQLQSGNIAHAYLFSGSRGTGKTSTARIFAKALNCQNAKDGKYDEPCGECETCVAIAEGRYLDLLEIDAASNRGIDEIRELRERVRLVPTEGRFKVYIIDEVHMLTNEAFNALLKTLEEPPEHAVFILATTEVQKVPATILSRVQRFSFQRPTKEQIAEKLDKIAHEEKWKIDKESLLEIAKASDGAYRDAEVLLDKVSAVNSSASQEEVRKIIGSGEEKTDLLGYLVDQDPKGALEWLNGFLQQGGNVRLLSESLLNSLRSMLLIKQEVGKELLDELKPEIYQELETFSKKLSKEKILKWAHLFTGALVDLRNATIPQLPIEIAIIEACGLEAKNDPASEEKTPKIENPSEKISVEIKAAPPQAKTEISKKEIVAENANLAPVKGGVGLQKVLDAWGTILKELKPKNNSLEIFLRSATPREIEDGTLLIEFGYRFHKDRFDEPKNRSMLEDILIKVLGEPVRIKGVVGEHKPRVAKKEETVEEADPVEVFGKLE